MKMCFLLFSLSLFLLSLNTYNVGAYSPSCLRQYRLHASQNNQLSPRTTIIYGSHTEVSLRLPLPLHRHCSLLWYCLLLLIYSATCSRRAGALAYDTERTPAFPMVVILLGGSDGPWQHVASLHVPLRHDVVLAMLFKLYPAMVHGYGAPPTFAHVGADHRKVKKLTSSTAAQIYAHLSVQSTSWL